MNIKQLIQSPDIHQVLRDFSAIYKPGMSSEEFMQYLRPTVRISATLGQVLGKKLGLRSTDESISISSDRSDTASISVICSFLSNGISVELIEQTATTDGVRIVGSIPSTPFHSGGIVTVNVLTAPLGTNLTWTTAFPGQIFAWGAGKRLVAKLQADRARVASRLRRCPSIIDAN